MNIEKIMGTTKLIIVRHGNTFSKGETPTRVGAKTDLDLVENHRGTSIGKYLKDNQLFPDVVFSSPLKRCKQTAQQAIDEMGIEREIIIHESFTEIDYGPDENKTEEDVLVRLGDGDPLKGKKIIDLWNSDTIVPPGWNVNPDQIIKDWKNLAQKVATDYRGQTVLIVSSNGIIRFAPHITEDFNSFSKEYDLKVATGSLSIFELTENVNAKWTCQGWNEKPYKSYPKK